MLSSFNDSTFSIIQLNLCAYIYVQDVVREDVNRHMAR